MDEQTSGYMSFRNVRVELSLDGSTWIGISGSTSAVDASNGDRMVHEFTPLFSDTTKAVLGTRDRVRLKVKGVYTENYDEAFLLLDTAFENKSVIGIRWTPAGRVPGAMRFSAVDAKVFKTHIPGGDFTDPKPIAFEFELTAEKIEKETSA